MFRFNDGKKLYVIRVLRKNQCNYKIIRNRQSDILISQHFLRNKLTIWWGGRCSNLNIRLCSIRKKNKLLENYLARSDKSHGSISFFHCGTALVHLSAVVLHLSFRAKKEGRKIHKLPSAAFHYTTTRILLEIPNNFTISIEMSIWR